MGAIIKGEIRVRSVSKKNKIKKLYNPVFKDKEMNQIIIIKKKFRSTLYANIMLIIYICN